MGVFKELFKAGGGSGGTFGAVGGGVLTSVTDWGHHVGTLAVFLLQQRYPELPPEVVASVEGLATGITALAVMALTTFVGSWFSKE